MKIRILICFLIITGLPRLNTISCQSVYFNETIDLDGEWGSGMSVLANDTAFHIAAITSLPKKVTMVELSQSGEVNWIKKYGNPQENWYPGNPGSLKAFNSGYFIGGAVETIDTVFGHFIKFDNSFDTILTRQYSNTDDDYLVITNSEICFSDELIFTGDISSLTGSPDLLLLKTDSLGNEVWRTSKNYGNYERGHSIIQTPDSGYIVGGYRYEPGTYHSGDPLIVKFDKNGNFLWGRNPGGPYGDGIAIVCLNVDSTFTVLTAIADSIYVFDFDYARICVIKYTQDGTELWKKKYGESIGGNFVFNIKPLPDGGYICCGEQNFPGNYDLHSSGWLLRLNVDGDSLWFRRYTYGKENTYINNGILDVTLCQDGGFIATGEVWDDPPNELQKIWVLKVDSIGCEYAGCDSTVSVAEIGGGEAGKQGGMEAWGRGGLVVWPNPASGVISVKCLGLSAGISYSICIYDLFGREIRKIPVPGPGNEINFSVENFIPGLYLVVLKDGNSIIGSAKIVVAR